MSLEYAPSRLQLTIALVDVKFTKLMAISFSQKSNMGPKNYLIESGYIHENGLKNKEVVFNSVSVSFIEAI
jgi:hypothetical protein